MPDSPGRELQVDVTCACDARFLATLDPHFITIETPSDQDKISARVTVPPTVVTPTRGPERLEG
jgi:hypothetical protein